MVWTGNWRRPHSYGDPADEVRAVHATVGVTDVSSLGKLLVEGSRRGRLPRASLPEQVREPRGGRVRYTVVGTDTGRIIDDGTVIRIGETTSS